MDAARLWLRLDHQTENELLESLIEQVTACAEKFGISIASQTWDYRIGRFPSHIVLPRAPVTSVTSIIYVDADGVEQTLSAAVYQTSLTSWPAYIEPAFGQSWPVTRAQTVDGVRVRFVAGFGLTGATPDIPPDILGAIRMALWQAYWHRDAPDDLAEAAVDRILVRHALHA